MHARKDERGAARLPLLGHLDEDVSAVRVSQMDGFGVDDDTRHGFALSGKFLQAGAEPVGVREEEGPVDPRDENARGRLESLMSGHVVVPAGVRVVVEPPDVGA